MPYALCIEGRVSGGTHGCQPWHKCDSSAEAGLLHQQSGVIVLRRHTSRFLVIWLFFLPLTLWPTARWSTIPASAVIAFLLLGMPPFGHGVRCCLPLG